MKMISHPPLHTSRLNPPLHARDFNPWPACGQVQELKRFSFWHLSQAIFLALALVSLPCTPTVAQQRGQTQEKLLRTLTVTGRGVEMIPATLAQVRLGVEVQGKTANLVQQEVARRSNAVVELLRKRNVTKLQTTGINLNPTYSYQNNVQRLTGFAATNTVSFRVDAKRAGTLLDETVKAGATRIDGVSFVASDSAIAQAKQKALRSATADAGRQADAVLGALNLTRREVVGIQVNDATPPPRPIPFFANTKLAGEAGRDTLVVPGEQEVDSTVTLQISY